MKAMVFDERKNILAEGPTSSGPQNELITWVDIYGRKVRSRHLGSGATSEFATNEDIGFAIPRVGGGLVVGTKSGPFLRGVDGSMDLLPNREVADGCASPTDLRWNDAKVSPTGELFLGTMAYDYATNAAAFYQLDAEGKSIHRLFGDVTISNGLDWSVNGESMFYIDTPLRRVDIFDVVEKEIVNRRTFRTFPEEMGSPDGMCVDSQDNLWVAFWMGGAVRCFDGKSGELLEEITCPAPKITSCVFGGENLDQLIITSASEETDLDKYPAAGMVFQASPGVAGQRTTLFGA